MPLYSYQCKGCANEFEQLVGRDDTPACPSCGSQDLDRMLGTIAPHAHSKSMIAAGRRQAAKEGHFSNYSKSELKGK